MTLLHQIHMRSSVLSSYNFKLLQNGRPIILRNKSTSSFIFESRQEYMDYLTSTHARLPWGFAVGASGFHFHPQEAPHLPARMTLSLIQPIKPTTLFGAVFTRNAIPGAPVQIGRTRLYEKELGAILINNKISNVCASGGGIADANEVCEALGRHLRLPNGGKSVLPSSTGVIGWRIPVDKMIEHIPRLLDTLQSESILPVAEGIMTTDLYPKIRSMDICGGRIVGIAKGAGMIEPNMATMLSYILTDLSVPRDTLRTLLTQVVSETFNSMSIDTDQSTSDTVAIVSSDQIPFDETKHLKEFKDGLKLVCQQLCEDVVRNGEGAHHVVRVRVSGADTTAMAKAVGKAVINSPLFKCAVAGNDPNVGRLVMAVGKYIGDFYPDRANNLANKMKISMGGLLIFENGEFQLNAAVEERLIAHMKAAQLTETTRGGLDQTSRDYPPHDKCVEILIELGLGIEEAQVLGIDLTKEYVAINADYRS